MKGPAAVAGTGARGGVTLRRALLGPFTTLSLGAAAIHFAVTDAHFQEWWAFGLFMVGIGWFQALWPIAYVLQPGVRLAALAAFANLATAAVWAWSRYAGLPFGPGAGQPQPVGLPDVLATLFEMALVVGLVVTSIGPVRGAVARERVSGSVSTAWAAGLAVIVAVVTSIAITAGMGMAP
jgi:hypothetical protein